MQGFWLLPCNCLERQRALKPDKRACKGAVQGACGPVRCAADLCECQANCVALRCVLAWCGFAWLGWAGRGWARVVQGTPFAEGASRESPRRARPFSLSRQRKDPQRKAARLPASLRFAAGNLRCSRPAGVLLENSRFASAQTVASPCPLAALLLGAARRETWYIQAANSQQPTANSQQPTANSQQPTANSQKPKTKNQNSCPRCARDWSLAWLPLTLEKGRGKGQRRWKKKKQSRRGKAAPLQKGNRLFTAPAS